MLNFIHKEGIIHFYIVREKIIELLFPKEPETQLSIAIGGRLLLNPYIWENALQIKSIYITPPAQVQLSG